MYLPPPAVEDEGRGVPQLRGRGLAVGQQAPQAQAHELQRPRPEGAAKAGRRPLYHFF